MNLSYCLLFHFYTTSILPLLQFHCLSFVSAFTDPVYLHFSLSGDLCLDPAGDYLVTITPDLLESDSPDLVVSRVFVVLPDEGEYAFPHNPHLADLWDTYIEEVTL